MSGYAICRRCAAISRNKPISGGAEGEREPWYCLRESTGIVADRQRLIINYNRLMQISFRPCYVKGPSNRHDKEKCPSEAASSIVEGNHRIIVRSGDAGRMEAYRIRYRRSGRGVMS